jgi:hypothetical protein
VEKFKKCAKLKGVIGVFDGQYPDHLLSREISGGEKDARTVFCVRWIPVECKML